MTPPLPTPATATAVAVTRRFGRTEALRGVDLTLRAGRITGLLGRNGAGKSTLLSLLAGRRRPTSGHVRVDGGDPFTDGATLARVCLVGDGGGETDTDRLGTRLDLLAALRPTFDADRARELLDAFELDERARIRSLSKGRRAAAAVTLGLAARAPLTLFDESWLGLDAHARRRFLDELLADYTAHPRTLLLSTHHVDEVAPLLEDVVVLETGRVLVHEPVDELVGRSARLLGPTTRVEALLAHGPRPDVEHLAVRRLGASAEAVVHGTGTPALVARAGEAGVEVRPLALEELFVHLTDQQRPSIADHDAQRAERSLA